MPSTERASPSPVPLQLAPERRAGPDFLGIGMAKAGTAWLGDQLRQHPQFWMPPVQELAYLGRDAPALRSANRKLERLQQRRNKARGRLDKRDVAFLEDITACTGEARDLDRYISFFRHKGEQKTGDISPGYCTLEEEIIRQLAERLPGLKVVLLIRDPLERLWSHLSMWYRNGKFDGGLLATPRDFRDYLAASHMATEQSFPTRILARWRVFEPPIRLRHFFFDDIATNPEHARREVFTFLDAEAGTGGELPAGHNRKAQSAKLELSEPIKAVLLEHCAEEIRACGRELGGWAQKWVAKYGL